MSSVSQHLLQLQPLVNGTSEGYKRQPSSCRHLSLETSEPQKRPDRSRVPSLSRFGTVTILAKLIRTLLLCFALPIPISSVPSSGYCLQYAFCFECVFPYLCVCVCSGCLCHLTPSILLSFPRKPEEDVSIELFRELSSIHTCAIHGYRSSTPPPPALEELPIIYM